MSTKKPHISKIAGWPKQDTAVGWYRIIQPGSHLKYQGFVDDVRFIPFSGKNAYEQVEFNDKLFMQLAKDATVFWTTMVVDDNQFLKMMNLRRWSGCKWIVDMDDNMYAVPRDNPAHALLTPVIDKIERCLSFADGITVSVPALKEIYGRFNSNIHVQKNALDFSEWDTLNRRHTSKVRIGWRGAYGHRDDLLLIEPVLRAIKNRYDIELVSFGTEPPITVDEHHTWVPALDYPKKLASLNLDIALVPLIDSSYNRCKSNLNWLENAALKTAIVYSPTENQKDLPGIPARTNHEWFEAIASLIEDAEYRKVIGKNGYEFARKRFNQKDTVEPLASFFLNTPRKPDPE